MRRVDHTEAEQIMRAAGCIPLVPYPGSGVPWPCIHEPCGRQIAPLFSNVRKRGRACRACAGDARGVARKLQHADEAVELMRAASFEPLEPYPGSDRPWQCIHEPCGDVRTPTLNTIRAHGTACRPCSNLAAGRAFWTAESAERVFREAGLEPLEPWPGSSSLPWRARHAPCGRVVSPRLGNIAAGQGPCRECGQEASHEALRKDHAEAAVVMRAAGLEPLELFPGVDHPWRCRHEPCGAEVSPTFTNIKRGQGGCVECAARAAAVRLLMPEEEARSIMAGHDLEPLEPYPGSGKPWQCRHSCGKIVTPTLTNVSVGKGVCRYCNSAFPYDGPAMLYLVVDRDAVKIGCCSRHGRRLDEHRRFGWEVAWSIDCPTGDEAYNLEQAVIAWWREDLGLQPARDSVDMPQFGYTETAAWVEMRPRQVLDKVRELADESGLPAHTVRSTEFLTTRPSVPASHLGVRARARQPLPRQDALEF